ncbi:MAG: hypothetical protein ABGW74_05190 [Campylobacterales bacterium]
MEIICSELYEKQLKEILEPLIKEDISFAKKFKMYLDTIIINIPTKVNKYKKSIYFDDENIKDLEYENYKVVFCVENGNNRFIILGIVKNT